MDFSYSEEQSLFAESLGKLLAETCDRESRKALIREDKDHDHALWQSLAEMGLLGLPLPEEHGGFDGRATDTMVAAIEFGRHLAMEPYAASVILGGSAIRLAGNESQKQELLPKVADGSLKLAAAFLEPGSRFDLACVETTATASGDNWVISGSKNSVLGGGSADKLVVSARTGGASPRDRDGLSLFLIDTSADSVSKTAYRMADGVAGADFVFHNVRVSNACVLGEPGHAFGILEHISDLGTAALCAEALGALEKINEITLDYLKMRNQFGRPIGDFQVLQHYMSDMLIEYEHAKSLVYEAAMTADSTNARERRKAISAAKVFLGEKGRVICQKAIQMHGGIGMTEEYELGDYVKRVMVTELAFGDTDHHLERYAQNR